MTIAIDASPAVRQLGGVSEYTYQLIKEFGAIDPTDRFSLIIFGRLGRSLLPLPPLPDNFTVRRLGWPFPLAQATHRLIGLPRLTQFIPDLDVFFAPHFLFLPDRYPRLVVTVHDVLFLDHPEWFTSRQVQSYTRALRTACQQADRILTISTTSRDALLRHGLVRPEQMVVIYLAAGHPIVAARDRERVRRHYRLPPHYAISVGTLEPRKNLTRLVVAYRRARERGVRGPLVLVGRRGWIGGDFDRALAAGPPDDIRVLGHVPRADRDALLSGAQMLLYPSLAEGFGIPVLEGMAAGVPVLTSNVSSLPEVAGDAALLVDPLDTDALADGIVRLATDEPFRRRLIRAGRTRSATFSWRRTARETLAVLHAVGGQT